MTQTSKNTSGPVPSGDFHSATGAIRFTFTNDYMFKFVFQNTRILLGFLCSLLRLPRKKIRAITVENPIILGQHISDKTFVLDIRVTLNDDTLVNIEMQVENVGDWPDRSLSYLCRSFDQLYHGQKYRDTKRVIHISILDYTLFPLHPEFYATYKLLNIKNHEIYNDKFQLNVLELNQINLATEEDRACGLDHWAALFKAKTWEEIKMLATENPAFDTIAQELYKANEDERIRLECEAREEFYFETRRRQQWVEEAKAELAEKNAKLAEQNTKLAEQNTKLAEQSAKLEEQSAKLGEQAALIAKLQAQIAAQKNS